MSQFVQQAHVTSSQSAVSSFKSALPSPRRAQIVVEISPLKLFPSSSKTAEKKTHQQSRTLDDIFTLLCCRTTSDLYLLRAVNESKANGMSPENALSDSFKV